MTKHNTEDFKFYAVKCYLNNDRGDGYKKTCIHIFFIFTYIIKVYEQSKK